ncbi:MAG: hypothetical protein ACJA00_000782, partial [Myxococcota bacterium]
MRWLPLLILLSGCSDRTIGVRNTAPDAEITSHSDGEELFQDIPTLFRGLVGDADQDPIGLEVRWFLGDVPLVECVDVDAEGVTECIMTLRPTDERVTLEVSDGAANGSDTITVLPIPEPVPNTPPFCSFTSPDAGSLYGPNESVPLVGSVDDDQTLPEELAVSFTSDVDGVLGTATPSPSGRVSFAASDLSSGEHELTLVVLDPEGERCIASVIIEVESGCGDGRVEAPELCDDSVNDGSYNGCLPGCSDFAPSCGDGARQVAFEDCDDGVNAGLY